MRPKLTLPPRSLVVLAFIRTYRREHGYSPCVREIMNHLGSRSTSLAVFYLDHLEDAGLIKRDPGVSRSIVVVGERR